MLNSAHLHIKLASKWVFNIAKSFYMGPRKLSPHCRENLVLRKSLRNAETMQQTLVAPPTAVFISQFRSQILHYLLAIFGSLVIKHIFLNALTHIPFRQTNFGIDIYSNPSSCIVYNATNIIEQVFSCLSVFNMSVSFSIKNTKRQ